jgi:hypothetical protein
MSAEDDLKRYIRDQERQLFDELAEMQRRSERRIEMKKFEDALAQRRLREKQIDKLWPQLYKAVQSAGMPGFDAIVWASRLVQKGKELSARRANQTGGE